MVETVIVFQRHFGADTPGKPYDIDYLKAVNTATPVDAEAVESTHPSYILYTSGTTGKPKGIIRDTGGYATALKFSMKYVYGMNQDEVFCKNASFVCYLGYFQSHLYRHCLGCLV